MKPVIFKCPLQSGGDFIAYWPQNADRESLSAIKGMLSVCLQAWIDWTPNARVAGSAEYDSWVFPAPPAEKGES